MNEKFHNAIKKAGEEISLSQTQREQMRRTLRSYMEMKPLRAPASAPTLSFGWFFTMRPVAATLVLALFISSAGISYAAEGALPGDALYAIKTHVNEPVQGALAVSASAKTAWAMDVAGERVKEAATLAAEGRLSASTQQELKADFERHAGAATDAISQSASSSPDTSSEAAVRFEAQLSEYENVLAQIGAAKNIDVGLLTASVKTERDHLATVRAQNESRVTSGEADHAAAARMGIAARAQLDVSKKLASAVSESLSSSSAQIVRAQLDDADSFISAGEDFTAKQSSPDALGAFRSALSATEKIGVFLNTSSAIHARTGLVVGEPDKSKRGGRSEGGSGSQGVRAAAALMNVSATSSTTTAPIETNTNTDDQKRSDDERKNENSGGQTLPVSVPIHISF